MTTPTENPIPSQQDDIKSVLQDTLFQQVQTLLNFTRTEGFALQIPNTDTHILAGPLARIAAFLRQDAGICMTCGAETMIVGGGERVCVHCPGDPANAVTFDSTRAALASQSQAAQPTYAREAFEAWASKADPGYHLAWNVSNRTAQRYLSDRTQHAFEGFAAAHIAGTLQAQQPSEQNNISRLLRVCIEQNVTPFPRDVLAAADEIDRLSIASQATKAQAEPEALRSCSEAETSAFEAWARDRKYDMATHPLHWLFLNERTYAARQGWIAALRFARGHLAAPVAKEAPVQMILHCPACGKQHVDAPDERTEGWVNPPHKSHLCHGCGNVWRPADVPTEGVKEVKTRGKNDGPVASVAKEATRDAETTEKANVLPPTRGTDSQLDAGVAVLSALREGIPLQEPVNITKAVLAQREARVSLSGGTGPVACAMLVNIQLTGWAEGPEKAEAFASGYNTAMKWYRAALLELAEKASVDAARRFRAQGGMTSTESGSDIATTTSTVSAPLGYISDDAMATLSAGSGILSAIIPRAINGAERAIYLGAQKAPEEVRNQAVSEGLEMAARHLDKQRQAVDQDHAYQEPDTGAWVFDRPETEEYSNTLAELADEIRALRTSSTDQANADTGSAE